MRHDEGGAGDHDVPADDHGLGEAPDPDVAGDEDEWAMGETERGASSEYDEPERSHSISTFLLGAVAGALALGLVWAVTVSLTDTDNGRSTTNRPTTGAQPSQNGQASPQPSRQDRCRQADAELAGPLRGAVPALDRWGIHVGAMNKLVTGVITLRQATAFWDQTRVGAKQELDLFYSEARRIPPAGVDCPSPDALTQASTTLRSCAKRVAAERRAFEAARVAMRTWKAHVRHMEMLRMGQMSPATATQLWLANWQHGLRELRAYRSAARAVDGSGSC